MSNASPASPQTPTEFEPSPWDEDEGAMRAEDAYLDMLLGRDPTDE